MGTPALDEPATAELTRRSRGFWSRRRKRAAAAGSVGLAAALVAAVLLASGGTDHAGAATGVPAGQTTTTVARRTLTESTTVDGTLGYQGSSEIYDRLATAGTFTWLPAAGAVIGRGGTLYRINNLPVVLMYGSVPAYRTLKAGVSDGPDVSELNANLEALGYGSGLGSSTHFSSATASAVRAWQHAAGLRETGEVEIGRVVFAVGAQRVTKLHVALGQDPPGSTTPEEPAAQGQPTSEQQAAEQREQEAKAAKEREQREQAARERSAKEHAAKEHAAKEHAAKEHERKASPPKASPASASEGTGGKNPSSKSPSSNGEGGSGGAGTLVMSTTSTQQVVQLQVKADDQQLAHDGEATPVTLPDGRTVGGHVTSVGTVATESSEGENGGSGKGNNGGGGESATIAVTITLDHRVARLDKAPVSVELVKAVRRNVLAVPATALTATAGGGYAIATLEGGRRVELPVTPGMFANGYVEIEGEGVHEGLTVIESQ